MKKLLTIVACGALATNSMAVAGCSFQSNASASIEKLVNEYANVASFAARPAILSTENNISVNYSYNYYSKLRLKDVMPQYFDHWTDQSKMMDKSTLKDVFSTVFDDRDDIWFTNHGTQNTGINFKGVKTPFNPSLNSNITLIRTVLFILSSKLGPYDVQGLKNIISSPNFASMLTKLSSFSKYGNSAFLKGMGKVFASLKTDYVNQTYEQVMQSAKLIFANFLNSFRKNPAPSIADVTKDDIANNIATLKKGDQLIQDSLVDIIGGNINPNHSFLSADGLPNLIKLFMLLGNYVEAFNNSVTSSLVLNDQTKGYDANHLFSTTQTNFQVKEAVLKSKFKPANLDLQEGARLLQLFFGVDPKNDSNGYNMLKLLNILFDNRASDTLSDNDELHNLGINYSYPTLYYVVPHTYGFDQIWIDTILGFIKGEFIKLSSKYGRMAFPAIGTMMGSVIYKLGYDISNNALNWNDFLDHFIGKPGPAKGDWFNDKNGILYQISRLVQLAEKLKFKIPAAIMAILTLVRSKIIKFEKDIRATDSPFNKKDGVFVTLYKDQGIKWMMDWINNNVSSNLINPNTISTLADIKTAETTPISNLLKLLGYTAPNYLYIAQERSLNDAINGFASELKVTSRYHKGYYLGDEIDPTILGKLFTSLGTTAIDNIRASGYNIPTRVANVDATKVSTLSYAMALLANNKTVNPNAGINGAFMLLGLNSKSSANDVPSFWDNSFFSYLDQIYGPNNFTGFHSIFVLLGDGLTAVQKGMIDNQNKNYLKYFNPHQWKVPQSSIKWSDDHNKRTITFDEYYTNPDTQKTTEYEISFGTLLRTSYSVYRWYQWKVINKRY